MVHPVDASRQWQSAQRHAAGLMLQKTPFNGVKWNDCGPLAGSEGLDTYMIVVNVWYSSKIV